MRSSRTAAALCPSQPRSRIPIVDNEGVILAQLGPRPARHVLKIDELPIGHVGFVQAKIIAYRRGNIEACALIQIGFWTFIPKHVLQRVCSKWSCVFPLRISNSIAFADRNPSIFASGNSWALIRFFKPRNNARRFRSVASTCFIVIGECAVKRVLPRCKSFWDIIAPMGGIWVIKTAVVFCPLLVPGT